MVYRQTGAAQTRAACNECIDVGTNVETLYPTSALSNAATNTASSSNSENAWKAFDTNTASGFESTASTYDVTGSYIGSDNSIDASFAGEYLRIEFSVKIVLTSYEFWSQDSSDTKLPKEYKIFGSDDGSSWIEVAHKNDNSKILDDSSTKYMVDSPGSFAAFKIWAVVVQSVQGSGGALQIGEWKMRGFECVDVCYGTVGYGTSSPTIYDFTSLTTLTDFQTFVSNNADISSTCDSFDVATWNYEGAFKSKTNACSLEISLPSDYHRLEISYGSGRCCSTTTRFVTLKMDDDLRSVEYNPVPSDPADANYYTTFKQTGPLKIEETHSIIATTIMKVTIETSKPTCTA